MLVKALLLRHAVVQAVVLRTGVGDDALLISGSGRIRDVIVVYGTWAVVHVLMLVLMGRVEGQIVAGRDCLLG